jgi:hypothetical protein
VVFVHDSAFNGQYFEDRTAIVRETPQLAPVPDGIPDALPRVVAHELGHGLGFAHRADEINLMAPGTRGTSLNDSEVRVARANAKGVLGVGTFGSLAKAKNETSTKVTAEIEGLADKELGHWPPPSLANAPTAEQFSIVAVGAVLLKWETHQEQNLSAEFPGKLSGVIRDLNRIFAAAGIYFHLQKWRPSRCKEPTLGGWPL